MRASCASMLGLHASFLCFKDMNINIDFSQSNSSILQFPNLVRIRLLQNDPDTGRIFSQPPLISFKRDKNIINFLVRSAFQTSNQPRTFKCARCKTCPFICNVEKFSGPKRSIGHFRNVRALGRVSYIDQIENLKIKTEMLMNEKLPDQV